ncbi:MAG TPA: ATP-binding protein [Rudaea sp.]
MTDRLHERVLILTPIGRDGPASGELLHRAGVATHTCRDLEELVSCLSDGASVAFVAEEALFGRDLSALMHWVQNQPAWSDLPFVILTSRHYHRRVGEWRSQIIDALRNVSLLERPVQAITLTSTILTAVRARQRQHQVRSLLEQRERAQRELQQQIEAATRDLREQMAERARIENSLRQSQKMEAIGQLTGGVAHDFNNLLTAIMGSLELLKKRLPPDERSEALLANAISGAERGATLTQRMLAFARRQELKIEAVDLALLVSGMRDLLERSIGPTVEIRTRLDSDLPAARTDANQLESALLNLAVNARDAMPDGGTINITAHSERLEAVNDYGVKPGQYVRLSVSDTGAGMDEATLSHATEPFFTTKGVGKGTGLGLSMVQGLAEQSGGKLRIRSKVGLGTTVDILFPVATSETRIWDQAMKSRAGVQVMAAVGCVVLVVDDDALVLHATSALLDDSGYRVVEAGSVGEAIELIESRDDIKVVVTDYAMPGRNGLHLAEYLQKTRPRLPVILATGYAELADRPPPNTRRLTKPFRRGELEDAVREAASRVQPAAPEPRRVAL